MLFSWKRRGSVLETGVSLLCDVIVNLNSKILKQKIQPNFFYILYSYSVIFPHLNCKNQDIGQNSIINITKAAQQIALILINQHTKEKNTELFSWSVFYFLF